MAAADTKLQDIISRADMKKAIHVLIIFLLIGFFAHESFAENKYTKNEYQIEMRDGVRLYTIVYSPIDTTEAYPILITRTPYSVGPYDEDKFRHLPSHLVKDNYIFVYQDVRGKFMSQGKYVNIRPYIPNKKGDKVDEASDTYDTIDWLVENIPNNNGRVGIYGISYPGFYSAMSLNDSHPALKAVSPQAPIADWFVGDDMHHNGAYTLTMAYVFFSSFGRERPYPTTHWMKRIVQFDTTSYEYFLNIGPLKNVNENYFHGEIDFWNKCMIHGTYDEFWQSRNTLNYFGDVKPAVMVVGGWYDNEDLYGTLNTYQTIEKKNKENKNILVMGPWYHGGWARSKGDTFGDMEFGSNTSEFYREEMETQFFKYYLKEEGDYNLPEAYVFETGKNVWHKYNEWPPSNTVWTPIYFSDSSELTFTGKKSSKTQFDEYISNPANPVPYTSVSQNAGRMYYRFYMTEDQRYASKRSDVLTFQTQPLDEDFTIAGPIKVELFVSTSGTDSDWIVKLIDVFPDSISADNKDMSGYQMMVRGDIMRGKFRNSLENPEPFVPNKPTKIKFTLNDSHHTFLKGHRIMVQVQSSWFPLFDRNPQKFCDIYSADESDFQSATNRVYHTEKYPSKIILNVIKK